MGAAASFPDIHAVKDRERSRQTFASPHCGRNVQNRTSDPSTRFHLYVEDGMDAKGNLLDLKATWPQIYVVVLRPPGRARRRPMAVPG